MCYIPLKTLNYSFQVPYKQLKIGLDISKIREKFHIPLLEPLGQAVSHWKHSWPISFIQCVHDAEMQAV